MLDHSMDWLLLYSRISMESKVDNIKKLQSESIDELQKFTYAKVEELESNAAKSRTIIHDAVNNCKQIESQVIELTEKFKLDNQNLLQFKQRLSTDIAIRMDRFDRLFGEMKTYL